MRLGENFCKGLLAENPILVLVLGTCPALAVTTSAANGLGMGLATAMVLVCSNGAVSLIRNLIPDQVRIPCYIVVIAAFVTIIDLLMAAYLPALHARLGIFIPLIVVNCIILGRAEAFASRNGLLASIVDGAGMGAGFTAALTVLGALRELFGSGALFGWKLFPGEGALFFVMAPGAFVFLGLMMAAVNRLNRRGRP